MGKNTKETPPGFIDSAEQIAPANDEIMPNPYESPLIPIDSVSHAYSKYKYRGQLLSFAVVGSLVMAINIFSIPWYSESFYDHVNLEERSAINETIDTINLPGFPIAICIFFIGLGLGLLRPGWGDITYWNSGFEEHMVLAIGAACTYGIVAAILARFIFRRRWPENEFLDQKRDAMNAERGSV